MKSIRKTISYCLVVISLLGLTTSCQTDNKSESEQQTVLDPAYENLLTAINTFEQENQYVTDVPTRKIGWGFVALADAAPVLLGTACGGVGIFGGAVLGIMNSFYLAFFGLGNYEGTSSQGRGGNEWANDVARLKEQGVDYTEMIGIVHNAVLQQLLEESEDIDYSTISDWALFEIIEEKVAEYLPEEATSISQSQFQQMRGSFPDSRNYIDYDSFEGACLNNYPGFEEDFVVALKVLSTIIAQEAEEQLDNYEKGVIQIIKESSIPETSKEGLIGTISVQKASKEFWYE